MLQSVVGGVARNRGFPAEERAQRIDGRGRQRPPAVRLHVVVGGRQAVVLVALPQRDRLRLKLMLKIVLLLLQRSHTKEVDGGLLLADFGGLGGGAACATGAVGRVAPLVVVYAVDAVAVERLRDLDADVGRRDGDGGRPTRCLLGG